jgi:hypothetical protein
MDIANRVTFLLAVTLLLVGVGPSAAAETSATRSSLNDGYSQFYTFCEEESHLSLLLWVKTAPPAIADYAREISTTASDDMVILKKFATADAAIRLDKVSLSPFEQEVRKSMAADRQKQLLWGSSGAGFSQAVSMTQSEATNYGLHVAKVLAEMEPDAGRAQAMQRICTKWTALHAEAYRLGR